MTIRFFCPYGHRLRVPDELAGKKGRCPVCQQRVYVPEGDPAAAKARRAAKKSAAPPLDIAPLEAELLPEFPALFSPADECPSGSLPDEAPLAAPGLPPAAVAALITAPPAQFAAPADQPIVALPPVWADVPPLAKAQEESPPPLVAAPRKAPPAPPTTRQAAPLPADEPMEAPLAAQLRAPPPAQPAAPREAPQPARAAAQPRGAPAARMQPATVTSPPFESIGPLVDSIQAPPRARTGRMPRAPAAAAEGGAYRPDPSKVQTVYLLAAGLVLVALFSAAPAAAHWDLTVAPGWARVVLLLAGLQLVYVAWMVSLPDWTTVWFGMLVFAFVAAMYGMGMAIALMTPLDKPLALGMSDVRRTAAGWCMAVVLLTMLMTYACGRVSSHWRRSQQLAQAHR